MSQRRTGKTRPLEGSGIGNQERRLADRQAVIFSEGHFFRQFGDFSQQFNVKDLPAAQRTALATGLGATALWDKGWFLFPNPVYGPWEKLGWDDIFPSDTNWEPK